MDFKKSNVQKAIRNADSIHQALVNLGYDAWEDHDGWDYKEMTEVCRAVFGDVVEMAILLGKYNQQVCNGGHQQYFDNGYSGYHGPGGRPFDYNYDVPLAQRTLILLRSSKLDRTDYGAKVHDCLQDFINRMVNHEIADEDEWDIVPDGQDDPFIPNLDDLDTAYYLVNEWWEHELERYFKLWMEFGEDPIVTERF